MITLDVIEKILLETTDGYFRVSELNTKAPKESRWSYIFYDQVKDKYYRFEGFSIDCKSLDSDTVDFKVIRNLKYDNFKTVDFHFREVEGGWGLRIEHCSDLVKTHSSLDFDSKIKKPWLRNIH